MVDLRFVFVFIRIIYKTKSTNILLMLPLKDKNINNSNNHTQTPINQHNLPKMMERPPLPKKSRQNMKTYKFDFICDQRKQNILNAKFLKKKQKLFQITRQNVRLFKKINSQKSIYSLESLNKSYQSNRSLLNSRLSNRSKTKSLKKSQISNCSQQSINSIKRNNQTFFNRNSSISSIKKQNNQKIVVRDKRSRSLVNLQQKCIENTKPEDIKQFSRLFNISEEPSLKERNRPIRIRSTKQIKSMKNQYDLKDNNVMRTPNKQIVINEQNQIQIHEQVELDDFETFRAKNRESQRKQSAQNQIEKRKQSLLKEERKIKMPVIKTQESSNRQLNLTKSRHSTISRISRKQERENLFDIKNSLVRQKLQRKFGAERVATKYSNLLTKINTELTKLKKLPQKTLIYPIKSRLIA